MVADVVAAQRDFSAGEIDPDLKRDEEHPLYKKGLRQCQNFRILDSGKLAQRPGRTAKFYGFVRVEEILVSGAVYYLCFAAGKITILNASYVSVFSSTILGDGVTTVPWTANTIKNISFTIIGASIWIAYADGAPNNPPQVLSLSAGTWSLATFAETISGNQKRTLFYRISPGGITMMPSNTTGAITVTFSAAVLVPAHVGTRMRYAGSQFLITGYTSSTVASATVEETLAGTVILYMNANPVGNINVGDVVYGEQTNTQAQVTAVSSTTITVVVLRRGDGSWPGGFNYDGTGNELIVAPSGAYSQATGFHPVATTPSASTNWDEEVMNTPLRGWPSFVFNDQGRLGFCNFPSVPATLAYSAVGLYYDFYIPNSNIVATNAIFEIAPNQAQVLYVQPGFESSEFIFCNTAIYYILINVSNPLSALSALNFLKLSGEGAAPVQPQLIQEAIVYVPAGQSTVRALTATGAYNRPYEVRPISRGHDHLFGGAAGSPPIAIAGPSATDPNYPERYVYVLRANGTAAVAKLKIEDGFLKEDPGWMVWTGAAVVSWISALGSSVWFCSSYFSATPLAELVDYTQYVDGAIPYNNSPATMANGVLGALWPYASQTCTVMDQGTRQMDTYQVSATGALVPQFEGGENLASSQLVAGQPFTCTAEPFIPAAQVGQSIKQRMMRRRVQRFSAYFQNSTGFVMARLFSGPLTSTSPALGTIVNQRRVATYNEDDDATQPPPLRDGAEFWRAQGRAFDPRVAIIKDTAGPLTILELGVEVTV